MPWRPLCPSRIDYSPIGLLAINRSRRTDRAGHGQESTRPESGKRVAVLPKFLRNDFQCREGADGLLFVGGSGKPFRRSTSGRKWRAARSKVGLPDGFRFYDLRHTGHTLATRSGATLKDTMVRAGQSSEKAALIYQHSDLSDSRRSRAGWTTSCGPPVRRPIRGLLVRIWCATPELV